MRLRHYRPTHSPVIGALGASVEFVDSFLFQGSSTKAKAIPSDKTWGKGIDVTFTANNNDYCIGFGCHPEFPSFREINSLDHEELFKIALGILESKKYEDSILSCSERKLKLLITLNEYGT